MRMAAIGTLRRIPMSTPPPLTTSDPPAAGAEAAQETRAPRTPLTPARVGASIGEDTDPELDVAPNLGGEQQMQDA
jgi:hypothetical protein